MSTTCIFSAFVEEKNRTTSNVALHSLHREITVVGCGIHNISYRITGFFCGCKFLRFVSKIGTCNFCDFIFCDFTPWQSGLYSLDDMKKTSRVTLNALIFMCIYLEVKLIFHSIEHIDRSPKQKLLCLVLVNKS